jgi:hypothetical protein
MEIQQKNTPDTLESSFLPVFLSEVRYLVPYLVAMTQILHKGWKLSIIGIQYMVVQIEDITGMGTILLEEVYQGRRVKLESSETVVG